MSIARKFYPLILLCLMIALTGLLAPCDGGRVQAAQRTLAWSVVDTPADGFNGMIIRPCGINDFALGVDGRTFYAVSTDNTTPNTGLFKSTDAGYSWYSNISDRLAAAGASFPVWNIAVAPDDVNFIIAVTDNSSTTVSGGPRMAYGSIDGGSNWSKILDLNQLPLMIPPILPSEYISCLDISNSNAGNRDIAIGTRSITSIIPVTGRLLTLRYSTSNWYPWQVQGLPAWTAVTSVKFSPNYYLDQRTLAVVSFTDMGAALHLGQIDAIAPVNTSWDTVIGYVPSGVNLPGPYTAGSIIRTGIALPSDYVGTDSLLRGCFVNMLNATASAVFYISPTPTLFTLPSTGGRIYSISYSGANATGILLAGASDANSTTALAKVWQCGAAQSTSGGASWIPSDALKSPTGGAGTGRANVLLAWSSNTAYCGTSAENSTRGGTGSLPGQWPFSKLTKAPSDESAFQYSVDKGLVWNQIGIINTVISQLSDTAAHEKAVDATTGATSGINVLYLASINRDIPGFTGFDSVWRSTSDPLGYAWERILTWKTSDQGMILRINPRDSGLGTAVVMADLGTRTIFHSSDEGNQWSPCGINDMLVNDISLLDDNNIYVLDDYNVGKYSLSGVTWTRGQKINTELLVPGHTICTPLLPSTGSDGKTQEIVVVGTGGDEDCYVAWADFLYFNPKFTQLRVLPAQGDVHVIMDDHYDSNRNIYAGITTTLHNDGNIYRWTTGTDPEQGMLTPVDNGTKAAHVKAGTESTDWDELDPINRSFFGLCMLNDVFYGAWNTDMTLPLTSTGADRTLEPRAKVPPPPEWDELRDGLPDSLIYPKFTREPVSLQASSNDYNTLWAIDNQDFDFLTQQGCLWSYVDSAAKLHPWPTTPPLGGFIGADPVTGRSQQIDFKWRPLKDIFGYDLLIAKDVNFTLLLSREVSRALSMIPVDNLTGAWIVTPADQESPSCWIAPGALEAGRPYYWRVRGSRTVENTTIHSPWSAAMFFSVKPGFPVTSGNMGPTLLTPVDGICGNCQPPMRFSWSPIKNAITYEFTLANDAQLGDVIVHYITHSTAYEYRGNLKPYKAYYWQVKAVAPVISDPSPVGTFSLAENNLSPLNTLLSAVNSGAAQPGLWMWIIIVAVAVLLFVILAYILISRRRY